MGLGTVFLQISADALFLARFTTARLPWVYFSSALLVPLCGVVYAHLQSRTTESGLGRASLGLLVVVSCALFAANRLAAGWPVFALRVFVDLANALVALTFWGPVGSMLDIRQAKRLYGLIGNGEVLAGILGGVAVVPLAARLDVRYLVLGAGLAFFACLGILLVLARVRPPAATERREEAGAPAPAESTRALLSGVARDRYVLLIVLGFLLYYVQYELLKYVNLNQVELRFGRDTAGLAAFLGGLAAVRTVVILSVRTFATGRLMDRFGLSFGLLSLPVVQIVATVGLLAVAAATRSATSLFWAVIALGLVEGIVRTSLHKPSVLVLYRPLVPARRAMSQTVVETFVDPAATALAGGLLLALNAALAGAGPTAGVAGRAGAMLLPLGGLLAVMLALRRAYGGVVVDALGRGHLKSVPVPLDEREAIPVAEGRLASADAREVLVAMGVLEKVGGRERLVRSLEPLLRHGRPEVRRRALELVEQDHLRPLAERARALANDRLEPDPGVRGAAARAVGALDGEEAVPTLLAIRAGDPEARVRQAAHVALLRYGGLVGALEVGAATRDLVASSDPADRAAAAGLLGEAGVGAYAFPLRRLLVDPEPRVRRAALAAAGRVRDAALWPLVLASVGDVALGVEAVRALRAGGSPVVPMLNAALHDPATPRRAAVRLAFALGEIGGTAAVAALLGHLGHALGDVRREVLASLRKCRYRAGDEGSAGVETRLFAEVRDAAWIAGALVDVGDDPRDLTLREALACELDRARDRVVSLLSFLYRPQPLLWVRRYLRSGSSERKAYALEVLGTLTGGRVRGLVFPLFEGRSPAEVHSGLASDRLLGREARLRSLLRADHPAVTPWLRVAALYGAALRGEEALGPEVRACAGDPHPLVRETATFASGRLGRS